MSYHSRAPGGTLCVSACASAPSTLQKASYHLSQHSDAAAGALFFVSACFFPVAYTYSSANM